MSLMIIKVVPQGLVLGADRNVTHMSGTVKKIDNKEIYEFKVGYGNRPKVLRWPNKKALVGYVGAASMGELFTDEWLSEFIGRNHDFDKFADLAKSLKEEAEKQRTKDDNGKSPEIQIFHLAGFEKENEKWHPRVYYISNCWSFIDGHYADVRDYFGEFPDVFAQKYSGKSYDEMRTDLVERTAQGKPCWYHQGIDLEVFNRIEFKLNQATSELVNEAKILPPSSLGDWENRVRFSLLTYGAYFQAFKDPTFQAVGGGADVFSLSWPT